MRRRGLEPPRELPHQHLKLARLPFRHLRDGTERSCSGAGKVGFFTAKSRFNAPIPPQCETHDRLADRTFSKQSYSSPSSKGFRTHAPTDNSVAPLSIALPETLPLINTNERSG